MTDPLIRPYGPRDADWLVPLHGTLYAREFGFDKTFALLVAEILERFAAKHDPAREAGWVAEVGGRPAGSIFCVTGPGPGIAKLRLFLLAPEARGHGLGARLLATCMGFARDRGYTAMTLWTHAEHRAACALYAKAGWRCDESKPVTSFGQRLTEQAWSVDLAGLAFAGDGR